MVWWELNLAVFVCFTPQKSQSLTLDLYLYQTVAVFTIQDIIIFQKDFTFSFSWDKMSYFRFKVLKFKLKVKRSQKWSPNVWCFFVLDTFQEQNVLRFQSRSLQAELDSYICTETLPQADPTSVANAVGTVYSRAWRWDFRLWVAPSSPDHSKNVCRRNPVSRSGVVMWGFVVGFWHIYSVDDGIG